MRVHFYGILSYRTTADFFARSRWEQRDETRTPSAARGHLCNLKA